MGEILTICPRCLHNVSALTLAKPRVFYEEICFHKKKTILKIGIAGVELGVKTLNWHVVKYSSCWKLYKIILLAISNLSMVALISKRYTI